MSDTIRVYDLAHCRAGDKGNRSNISLIPYKPDAYPLLLEQVTEARVLELFAHKGASKVTRYELPNLPALNFVHDGSFDEASRIEAIMHRPEVARDLAADPAETTNRLKDEPERAAELTATLERIRAGEGVRALSR